MGFNIQPPLTSAPRKQKRLSMKDWEEHKELVIGMRMQGKTAEEIRSALARKGFHVSITPIKKRLSEWSPKNSSHRRKRLTSRPVRRCQGPMLPFRGEGLPEIESPATDFESSGSHTGEESTSYADTHSPLSLEAMAPRYDTSEEPDDFYSGLLHVDEEKFDANDNDTQRLVDIATDILSTLQLDTLGDASLTDGFPSFDAWNAEQESVGVSNFKPYRCSYTFKELLQLATDFGKPEPVVSAISLKRHQCFRVSNPGFAQKLPEPKRHQCVPNPGFAQALLKSATPDTSEGGTYGAPTVRRPRSIVPDLKIPEGCEAARAAALRSAGSLLQRSADAHDMSLYMESFTNARDAFEILKTLRPPDFFRLGYALQWMGWALLGLYQRFPDIFKIFNASLAYFRQSGNVEWELYTMQSIAQAHTNWPAPREEIEKRYTELLMRLEEVSCDPVAVASCKTDVLFFCKTHALRSLAILLPPALAVQVQRSLVISTIKRRGPDSYDTARVKIALASSANAIGNYKESLEQSIQAYSIYKSRMGPVARDTIARGEDIFYLLLKMGRYRDALGVHRMIAPVLSRTKLWTADGICAVGRMMSVFNQFHQALTLLQKGITDLKYNHPHKHHAILEAEEWIADALYQRGLVMYAQPIAMDYMKRSEMVYGKDDLRTLDAILFCLRWGMTVPEARAQARGLLPN